MKKKPARRKPTKKVASSSRNDQLAELREAVANADKRGEEFSQAAKRIPGTGSREVNTAL